MLPTMNRRQFLLASLGAGAAFAQSGAKPNVVFFMTDDHGAWALNAYGCSEIDSPNIDRLAASGTLFERAFSATPVCSPSRATFYTGKLPTHHGVQDFLMADDSYGPKSKRFMDGHTTYAEVLKDNGYLCALIGKWHLGDDARSQSGFDYWATSPRGAGPYRDVPFYRNGEEILETGYKTDFIGDEAVRFLDANHDKPFCLTVPFFAPHDPFDYQPEEYREPYLKSKFSCYPEAPLHPQRRGRHSVHLGNRESMIGYSALVTGVDRNVGKVLDKLDELGLNDNTVVVFSADQGYNCGHHGFWGKGNGTIPFNMYEESIRIPMIWSHPGKIPAGKRINPMVSSYDFFPTLLDYLGVEAPADPQRVGESFAPFLRGESPRWRTELYFEFGYVRSVRTENLRYIERGDGWGDELYDLETDPNEEINRIGKPEYRDRRIALRQRLHAFFDRIGAPPINDWRDTTEQMLPTDSSGYYEWIESVRTH